MQRDRDQRTKASWRGAIAASAAVGALVLTGASWERLSTLTVADEHAPVPAGQPVDLSIRQDEYGLSVGFTVRPGQDRWYTAATVHLDQGEPVDWAFWSRRWDDHHPPPDPFPVKAHTRLGFWFWKLPDCGEPPSDEIVVELTSTLDSGAQVTETFAASNVEEYRAAYARRCAQGVSVHIGGGNFFPNGDAEVTGSVINPGPDVAEVVIPELRSGDTHWAPVRVRVPPGERHGFSIEGTGAPCDRDTPDSWNDGRTLVNGVPYVIADTGDHWCG